MDVPLWSIQLSSMTMRQVVSHRDDGYLAGTVGYYPGLLTPAGGGGGGAENIRMDINEQKGTKMNSPEDTKVVVTDIQMPFISMVVFRVKWALAAIPALFILIAIFTGIFLALGMTAFY